MKRIVSSVIITAVVLASFITAIFFLPTWCSALLFLSLVAGLTGYIWVHKGAKKALTRLVKELLTGW